MVNSCSKLVLARLNNVVGLLVAFWGKVVSEVAGNVELLVVESERGGGGTMQKKQSLTRP